MTGHDDFQSNVSRPRRPRPGIGQLLGHALFALVVIAGLVGALLLAGPSLDVEHQSPPQAPEAATNP